MRDVLWGFYGNLKSEDQYIRFIFITGVTRFDKVSIFSDLNNLNDIVYKNNGRKIVRGCELLQHRTKAYRVDYRLA